MEPPVWARLKALASAHELTPSGLLCTAFCQVLAAWSASPAFTINLTTFQRLPLHPEVDRMVGDFTSTTLLTFEATDEAFLPAAKRLQRQMWRDLDHRAFSGVEVLRELSRRSGRVGGAMMPVVFTSTLVHASETTAAAGSLESRVLSGVSQTPQVFLDHQVFEHKGALSYNWDVVEEIFPQGLTAAMFDAYRGLLARLAEEPESWNGNLGRYPSSDQVERRGAPIARRGSAPPPPRAPQQSRQYGIR